MRTLTPETVLNTAIALMHTHGTTTTLEVKTQLRNDGHWALQADVSLLMDQLARREGWHYQSTGRYRIYALTPGQVDTAAFFQAAPSFGTLFLN